MGRFLTIYRKGQSLSKLVSCSVSRYNQGLRVRMYKRLVDIWPTFISSKPLLPFRNMTVSAFVY